MIVFQIVDSTTGKDRFHNDPMPTYYLTEEEATESIEKAIRSQYEVKQVDIKPCFVVTFFDGERVEDVAICTTLERAEKELEKARIKHAAFDCSIDIHELLS